jgi:hypothetical protein
MRSTATAIEGLRNQDDNTQLASGGQMQEQEAGAYSDRRLMKKVQSLEFGLPIARSREPKTEKKEGL